MNIDQLVFFNKEGYAMNMNQDPDFGFWNAKMYFDKNSTDTFKTLGIYMFEKILPSRYTFNAYLDKFQAFNTDNFYTWPKFNAVELEITDIKKSNNNNLFFTKWIYGDSIERYYQPGQWVYFEGLNGYHGTDFDTTIGSQYQLFQVLQSQPGRIMVKTTQNNSVVLAPFVAAPNIKIFPANVIEFDKSAVSPTWQETSGMSKIFTNKKLNLIANSESDGIWTCENPAVPKGKQIFNFGPAILSPSIGDYLSVNINVFTDRLQISNGNTSFAPFANPSSIEVPYIPYILNVGDTLQAEEKSTPLFGPNTVTFTVTAIDKISNRIDVTPAPTLQSVDCYLYRTNNTIRLKQDIVLDNNNLPSLPVSYWSFVNTYKSILNQYDIDPIYDAPTDSILFKHMYADIYFNVNIEHYNANNTLLGTYSPSSTTTLNVYPYWIKEDLTVQEEILANTTNYSRTFIFNTIDNAGLNLTINGIAYNVDYDISVANTTADWISQFAATLSTLGIQATLSTTFSLNDTITIEADFPNRPIFIQSFMGDFSDWYTKLYSYQFNNIKSQLLINIDGTDYAVPFFVSDALTVTNWFTTYEPILAQYEIYVANPSAATLEFRVKDPEKTIAITYNIGYLPKSGDASVFFTDFAPESKGGVIVGNEIKVTPGTYDFLNYYSTGQKISINGALKTPQNTAYNIIGLLPDTISLSYQGPFWQQGLPLFLLDVNSDFFLAHPKHGISSLNSRSVLRWSWKETQNDEIFFYDFSGDQLKPAFPNFPNYAGPLPLCGVDGSIELKLNKFPNKDLNKLEDPTAQQTVFDLIENNLPFTDEAINVNSEPTPIQTFIGYNSPTESYNKSRLYVELIEDISFELTTDPNFIDNLWTFSEVDNSLEITSPLINFDFQQLGFKQGQIVEITSVDVNVDGRKLTTLLNHGRQLIIKEVFLHKITFEDTIYSETSVKSILKTTAPFYDPFGNPYMENRRLSVTLKVMPKLVAYFDIYGESEQEDERHRINLDNRNLNILKLQDFFIFKEVDIKEQGVDWIILNRKRKELLEIYSEIFNYVSSYKAIIQAINFFGYNDLTFTEYFQNINPDSKKFSQIFNMELLYIFDKAVKGWEYSNLAVENLRNLGYRKTNLFSLNYRITDADGNFVNGYSLEEVQIKLLGLKRWLKENLVPMGAKLIDINGKYRMPINWTIKHETYASKRFNVTEYSTPVDFYVDGYLQPVTTGSDQYNISVKFMSAGPIEWFDYTIRTFHLDPWNETSIYSPNDIVYWDGLVWKATGFIGLNQIPGISVQWIQVSIDTLPNVQIIHDWRHNDQPATFTINKLVDPHFIVEVNWHSGYGCTLNNRKTYSLIPGFFDKLK